MQLEIIHQKPLGIARSTPLLFVHGKWHGAWCWQEHFLPYFAAHGYDCHALSLRGHAGSQGHENLRWTSIAAYVEDIARVVASLERPPVLIGHSMGGFIVQKYLEKHAAPAAVLLTAIPPFGLWQTTRLIFHRCPLVFMKALFSLRLYPIVETAGLAREALFSADMPPEKVSAYHLRLGDESIRAYFDELGLNLVRRRHVKTPLLVIGARDDAVITTGMVLATARCYNTTAEIFPAMAHDVMLEAGWEKVAARILDWLDEPGILGGS